MLDTETQTVHLENHVEVTLIPFHLCSHVLFEIVIASEPATKFGDAAVVVFLHLMDSRVIRQMSTTLEPRLTAWDSDRSLRLLSLDDNCEIFISCAFKATLLDVSMPYLPTQEIIEEMKPV